MITSKDCGLENKTEKTSPRVVCKQNSVRTIIATNKFKFEDCTYDFLLDYRNHLHDVLHLSEKTSNNRLAVIKSYMNYASARDVSLQQYAFAVSQVPFYTVPKIQQPIIEDMDSLAALLAIPPNTKKGLRDRVIMSVLYDGGILNHKGL